MFRGLSELTYAKHLAQCLARSSAPGCPWLTLLSPLLQTPSALRRQESGHNVRTLPSLEAPGTCAQTISPVPSDSTAVAKGAAERKCPPQPFRAAASGKERAEGAAQEVPGRGWGMPSCRGEHWRWDEPWAWHSLGTPPFFCLGRGC